MQPNTVVENITDVYDAGDGVITISLSAAADISDDLSTTGFEALVDGEWIAAAEVVCYSTFADTIYAVMPDTAVYAGLPWRIVSPLSGLTVSGTPLDPLSGIISAVAMMAGRAGAIRPSGLRKSALAAG